MPANAYSKIDWEGVEKAFPGSSVKLDAYLSKHDIDVRFIRYGSFSGYTAHTALVAICNHCSDLDTFNHSQLCECAMYMPTVAGRDGWVSRMTLL